MKNLTKYISEGLKVNSKSKFRKYNYSPKTKDELKELIKQLIKERGNKADLNDIDTSEITDMSYLFDGSDFNGDISCWNVSNVNNMLYMFYASDFNGDISEWDVSKVEDMERMFTNSIFNGDISKWKVLPTVKMTHMLRYCPLEKNPPKWYKND